MRFFALLMGENADIEGLLIFGFYLRRHAWRKNVSIGAPRVLSLRHCRCCVISPRRFDASKNKRMFAAGRRSP